jgi:gluconate 2-dehydrogenase gamma chain
MAKQRDTGSNPPQSKRRISRRAFLKGTGLVAAATSASTVLSSCATLAPGPAPSPTPRLSLENKYLHVPVAPTLPPDPDTLLFLTPDEARTLDAIVAVLIPGTPEDPGAREAGVVTFMDHMLATSDGWAEPTYTEPPFVETYEGDTPPPPEEQKPGFIYIPEDRAEDYGWQVAAQPQELYRVGLAALNEAAGGSFADLSEDAQESLLISLADDELDAFETDIPMFSGGAFFDMLLTHTRHGMFGDPLYGGNRFLVGWKLVGYPGARRAYTAQDMLTEGTDLEPWSMAKLPPFHPGQPVSDDVVIPLANGDLIQQQTPKNAAERLLFCQPK